jgi:hypothetical protein
MRTKQLNRKQAKTGKRDEKTKSLVYAYCIIDSNQVIDSAQPLTFQGKKRSGFGRPYLVPFRDISAVVSKVPEKKFNQSAIDRNTKDIKWLSDTATKHEDLVESVMSKVTAVPLKLCTIFKTEDRVKLMLKQNYGRFSAALRDLRGAVELGVSAYLSLDLEKLADHFESNQIKEKKKQILNASEGRAYFLKQELQEMLVAEFASRAYSSTRTIYDELKGYAEKSKIVNPIRSDDTNGMSSSSNEMILNATFLVKKEDLDKFKEKYEEIRTGHLPDGITLKLTGPWPPYNFVE